MLSKYELARKAIHDALALRMAHKKWPAIRTFIDCLDDLLDERGFQLHILVGALERAYLQGYGAFEAEMVRTFEYFGVKAA